ncbi:tetratricopeptide repeat protein 16-like isoform X2 [Pecten maximus]|uniref:tetratricopeptide repeat protein 16-like isoform X2 n=1 Tax=Pecten maximus TaxID=6579 RepID=UPI001458CDC3|nr:tetratricopeptide repeat protein 16-like isoform X2 [Pecten maximus]
MEVRQDTDVTNPSMTSIVEEAEPEVAREDYYSEPRVSPVEMELSELSDSTVGKKKMVNIHQFYPQLEHTFTKSSTRFAEEQDKRTEEAMKEIVDESTFTNSEKDFSSASQLLQLEDTSLVQLPTDSTTDISDPLVSKTDVTDATDGASGDTVTKEDDNNSAADKKPASVFSTTVSEETLNKARARRWTRNSIFQTEDWGPVQKYSAGMQDILEKRAAEHFTRAMLLKASGDQQGCINAVNKAMGLAPDVPKYYVERAEAYIQLCDFKSAILNYKKACLLEANNEGYYSRLSFLYYFQGQTLFDQRLYPEALECFSSAAEMNPDNVGYHIRSITCLAALQRHGECLALVNKRLETEVNNPDLYIMRARLHEMFRNTTLCYYDIKDALSLDEGHVEAKKMMAHLERRAQENKAQAVQLNLAGKHREALQKISIAIETNPNMADFHVLRGTLHRKLGDFNAAIDDFLLALDKCDHNEESQVYLDSQRQLLLTYNDFAVECFTKGFYEESIILLNKAIKGEKREKGLYINRGDCFFRQNDLNFALQDYNQALEIDPNDAAIQARISVIYNEYGVTAYQDKNYPEADSKFTEALKHNPKVGQYYISRARARYMLESMVGARQDLLMGLLLDPTNEDVISILSRLFPGKSVAEVINSRAADTAKLALKAVLFPPRTRSLESKSGAAMEVTFDEGERKPSAVKTEWSQAESDVSQKDSSGPPVLHRLKTCMTEQDFALVLMEGKKQVHMDIKSSLRERKSLKYEGPRVQPLPPPMAKPRYGGLRKERLIKSPGSGEKKRSSTNWKQFSMGIGLANAAD